MLSANERIVPNFFVAGTHKAGTTFLCHHLGRHEKVFVTKPKEAFFFSKPNLDDQAFEKYVATFFPADKVRHGTAIFAEGSTGYFQQARSLPNMKEFLGDSFKVVVSLRHPVTKAISWYMHNYRRGRLLPSQSILDRRFVRVSEYARHARRWSQDLGPDRLLFITFDLLERSPLEFVNTAVSFAGLQPFHELSPAPVNPGFRIVRRGAYLEPIMEGEDGGRPVPRFPMSEIRELQEHARKDVRRTQSITGLDLRDWLELPEFEEGEREREGV